MSNDERDTAVPPDDSDRGPAVWAHLGASLDVYRDEHREYFASPETPEEFELFKAFDVLEAHALEMLTTGDIPASLEAELAAYQPGSAFTEKVAELVKYNVIHHRLEFDVADEVVSRLSDLDKRIFVALIAFLLLLRAKPSPTAVKYLRQASRLFLAGYRTEVLIMCGAVLEAAMADRFPDNLLRASGLKPVYKHTGIFSLGQRMQYEEEHSCLTGDLRQRFWQVINWRNDAVHVQPDIGPDPAMALLETANLLPAIVPRDNSF